MKRMIKRLWSYAGKFKKQAFLTPVLVLLETVAEILIPLVTAKLLDEGINGGDMNKITYYGVILLIFALLALAFGVFAGFTATYASAGFARNLRKEMYYRVQDFSFSNIDKFSTGSIVTRLTTDVSNVQQGFQMLIRICFRAPAMLVFALIAAVSISPSLSLVYFIGVPILAVGMLILINKVHPIFERVFKTYDKLNNIVAENLYAMRVVKSFNREKHEADKFKGISKDIYGDFTKAEVTMSFAMPLMQLIMYASMILISWFGAKMIIASGNNPDLGLTTGKLMSMITYSVQILMSLMMLCMVTVMLVMGQASGERIVELLDEEVDIKDPENPIFDVKNGQIDFENISFGYRHDIEDKNLTEKSKNGNSSHREVIKDLSLHIPSGATVGILGGTGSAKSTLVQLVPRLYDVTKGSVKVGGVDVRDYDIDSLRKEVAMVLQKNVLFSGTIKENLRWGNENATDDEILHACKVACADEFISKFPDGYDTYIEQGGSNVSGGQKQRLSIARALLKKPKILILDDSTSAVDTKTDALIRNALSKEMPGATKIIIAQRVSSIMDSDMIVVLDGGEIKAVGTHDELLDTCDIYREVYESQNKGGENGGK